VAGSQDGGLEITYLQAYNSTSYPLATFKTPSGTAWRYIPVPTAQVGIGLPLGTELKSGSFPGFRLKREILCYGNRTDAQY